MSLRSPGYQVGSLIWSVELRWECDPEVQNKQRQEAQEAQANEQIVDLRSDEEKQQQQEPEGMDMDMAAMTMSDDDDDDDDTSDDRERKRRGYTRLGIYIVPRSMVENAGGGSSTQAMLNALGSLKANCEVRINDLGMPCLPVCLFVMIPHVFTYVDAVSVGR